MKNSASSTRGAGQPWSHAIASRLSLLAICLFVLLTACLYSLLSNDDPARRFRVFEIISSAFFALVLLRSLLVRNHAGDAESNPVAPGSAGAAGLLIALAAGALAYAATFRLYFLCDDFDHLCLVRLPFMQSLWPQMTKGQTDGMVYIFYRPLGFASLFLDFRLWHYWAPGYHLTNILLHLLCIAGVFYFCREVGLRHETCLAASLIFAVLPVNVQAVAWVPCRFDQLAVCLGVWSLTCAARFRRTGRFTSYLFALFLFVLAVLSKEVAYIIAPLWLALELLPQAPHTLQPPFTRRSEPLLGYVLIALVMWVHRWHVLGGVGGYRMASDGSPLVQSFRMQSLIGVVFRAPAETLFGYDWLKPAGRATIFAAGATAAILLALSMLAKTNSTTRRVSWFCLLWVFAAAVPAHFYFCSPDPGLFSSRALYFGSIGAAILIAMLLGQTIRDPKLCLSVAIAMTLLLWIGVQHNIAAWQAASQESLRVQAVLDRQPAPPLHTVYYLKGIPDILQGVPFFTVGLQSAVRFHYSWRDDIRVRTEKSLHIEASAIPIDLTPPPSSRTPESR